MAGVLAGWLGSKALSVFVPERVADVGLTLSSLFLLAFGFYVAGWWQGLAILERGGLFIWRRIEPWGQGLLPVRHPGQALVLGLLWGWLPCGLVYSTLGWAALQPTVGSAALTMLFFGLGTLPSMLATGFAANWIRGLQSHQLFRKVTGGLLILFGLWTLPFLHMLAT